ncbi:MAG: ArsA family ATPase [Actinomycetota bacterium]
MAASSNDPPRTILYMGKGGVGKTSVAAATARRCAASGLRTLILSTDPAHSLSDALEIELSDLPAEIGDRLWGQEIHSQTQIDRNWAAASSWLSQILIQQGVNPIAAGELAVPPGADELFALLALKSHHESGEYDVIVVDCAPTGETLRLLSFPDVASWWTEKLARSDRQIFGSARPFIQSMLDIRLPDQEVLADVHRLVGNLVAMNEILRDRKHASIRLVMTPERMVISEAMRTFTYLNLYGFLTDAVIVNRVFPVEVDGTYFAAWRGRQQEQLSSVQSGFTPVPILHAPYFAEEVVGVEMLDRLGDVLFGDRDAAGVMHDSPGGELTIGADSATLRLDLPFAEREQISLKKIGAQLIVSAGDQRRTIMLPPALAGHTATEAKFADGALLVTLHDPNRATKDG